MMLGLPTTATMVLVEQTTVGMSGPPICTLNAADRLQWVRCVQPEYWIHGETMIMKQAWRGKGVEKGGGLEAGGRGS